MNDSQATTKYDQRVVEFRTEDGRKCNVVHIRGDREPTRGPVLLVHGAGVRANIFCAPVKTTIIDVLLEQGHDVWLENWRGSIEFPPNEWNLDQAAIYDHPAAVRTVLSETGKDTMKAIIHCQGSTSFMMSAMAGFVPQVRTIVSNAVSLHPVVPRWSRTKLQVLLPMVRPLSRYMNPHWGVEAPTLFARLVNFMVNLFHHECDNAVCKGVSFTYGAGCPALWSHENISETTHEWIKEEFNAVPLSFFEQIKECVVHGSLVSMRGNGRLPHDLAKVGPMTDARFSFVTGVDNLCFLPESQRQSFEYFDARKSDYHTLHEFKNYGHLDIFIGERSADEIFPAMLGELDDGR